MQCSTTSMRLYIYIEAEDADEAEREEMKKKKTEKKKTIDAVARDEAGKIAKQWTAGAHAETWNAPEFTFTI